MKRYFVTSDVHSNYTALLAALTTNNFDFEDPDHILVINGDLFDRCDETILTYSFIKSLPKKRRILIRGNHEYLFKDMLRKTYPEGYDFSNGTVKTAFALAGKTEKEYNDFYKSLCSYSRYDRTTSTAIFKEIKKNKNVQEVAKWFDSTEWVDRFEINNYIITHSFIPLFTKSYLPPSYLAPSDYVYLDNWRKVANKSQLEDSTWGCPYKLYKAGLFDTEVRANKILVCGHWHTSDFFKAFKIDAENIDICPLFRGDLFGINLIALDACTVRTNRCNMFIFEA